MEFKVFFSTMKNRISDGYDVPEFFRDLFAMITDVPEDEWGTPQDPATKKTKDNSLRSYAKRTIPKKFAQNIVYRLSTENYIESLNSRPVDALRLLAADFISYDSEINENNVAEKTAAWFVEIIRDAAGLVPKEEMEHERHQQTSLELKRKYGAYLLNEASHYCPFPGCGRSLTKANGGRTIESYEVSVIDKKKAPEIQNLVALCPQCHATYFLDDTTKSQKELLEVKKLLETHASAVSMLDNLPLEAGIIGVIKKVSKLKEKDLVAASLDPKEIKQKVKPSDDFALYNQVNMFVSMYFLKIREIMMNLDKRGDIDYDEIQNQIRAIYKRLKKAKKSKTEIYNEIVAKVQRVSLQENIYCQIIVSYFIQSCEVFDATS